MVGLRLLRGDVARWGWRRSLLTHALQFLKKVAGVYLCWVVERRMILSPGDTVASGIVLRKLDAPDLQKATNDPELEMSAEFVSTALARGDVAFGAFDDDRLISYAWVANRWAPHTDDIAVEVDPPRHYGYKALTRPLYRGRHILGAVARYGDSYLCERGYIAQVMFVEASNPSAFNVQKGLGSRVVGLAGYIKRFGIFVPFRTPAVKAVGFRFCRRK